MDHSDCKATLRSLVEESPIFPKIQKFWGKSKYFEEKETLGVLKITLREAFHATCLLIKSMKLINKIDDNY